MSVPSLKEAPKLALIDLDDGWSAQAIRNVAEYLGYVVSLYPIGAASQLVEAVELVPAEAFIILCCHGDEAGLHLPELHPDLAKEQPMGAVLTPADVRKHLRLKGQDVLCLGCFSAQSDLVAAFKTAGAKRYAGFEGEPEGNAVLMAVLGELVARVGVRTTPVE